MLKSNCFKGNKFTLFYHKYKIFRFEVQVVNERIFSIMRGNKIQLNYEQKRKHRGYHSLQVVFRFEIRQFSHKNWQFL